MSITCSALFTIYLQFIFCPCLTLANEKYIGDVLLQKTFVENMFSGKQIKDIGQKDRYLIQEHHPAIVSKKLFEKVNSKYSQI